MCGLMVPLRRVNPRLTIISARVGLKDVRSPSIKQLLSCSICKAVAWYRLCGRVPDINVYCMTRCCIFSGMAGSEPEIRVRPKKRFRRVVMLPSAENIVPSIKVDAMSKEQSTLTLERSGTGPDSEFTAKIAVSRLSLIPRGAGGIEPDILFSLILHTAASLRVTHTKLNVAIPRNLKMSVMKKVLWDCAHKVAEAASQLLKHGTLLC